MARQRTPRTYPHQPDYATPPGYVLQDYLEAWDFTPAEFARRHSLAAELIEGVIAGDAPIDEELAAIFGREFSLEAGFWLRMEADYRRRLQSLDTSSKENATEGAPIMVTSTVKRIICLANSRKPGGSCIAGKELLGEGQTGAWIRPVSARDGEAVSELERCYVNGRDPQVLDIIDISLLGPRPKAYQRENWLLNSNRRWSKVGQVAWNDLQNMTDDDEPLWLNGHSTANGYNDQIPDDDTARYLTDSLRLIKVGNLELFVSQPGLAFGNSRRRLQGRFQYGGSEYRLWVTDTVYEHWYLQQPNGSYPIGECYLTVSLGEPHNGYGYKLIAAIIKH